MINLSPEAQVEWDRTVASLGTWDVAFERDGKKVLAQHIGCSGGAGCFCRCWTGNAWVAENHTQVQALTEVFRNGLGLKTWVEHRREASQLLRRHCNHIEAFETFEDSLRGSGRTTRGLLEHLAHCTLNGARVMVVCGGRQSNTEHCVSSARQMVYVLGLTVKVEGHRHIQLGSYPHATYIDHYLTEQMAHHNRRSGF